MKIVKGDIFDIIDSNANYKVLVHGCNCFCEMGAGIAKQIKILFPEAYEADIRTIKGDRSKMGSCSWSKCTTPSGNNIIIVNAYTQYHYGRKFGMPLEYGAIRACLKYIESTFSYPDESVSVIMPKIGAGLAGGDWNIIKSIIEQEEGDLGEVTVVEYTK